MIGYHPALDPHHTAFRMLRLLLSMPEGASASQLRILDFFLLFPEAIGTIRLPKEQVTWRSRLKRIPNPYWFDGDRSLVFTQMDGVQESALGILSAAGWIVRDGDEDHIQMEQDLSDPLRSRLDQLNEAESELVEFLTTVLGRVSVTGDSGLKHRTGLLEYRYDPS